MPHFPAGRSYSDDANTPYGLDISAIAREIGTLQGIKNVHHAPL
mgnify:CR=1 FL=1|jgi:hypothetical protein